MGNPRWIPRHGWKPYRVPIEPRHHVRRLLHLIALCRVELDALEAIASSSGVQVEGMQKSTDPCSADRVQ